MMGGYGRGYGYDGGYGNMMGGSWFGGAMMLLFGALILVGIVLLVIWAVRSMSGSKHHQPVAGQPMMPPSDDACNIAKVRYAKGEITKEQYEELCKTLGV